MKHLHFFSLFALTLSWSTEASPRKISTLLFPVNHKEVSIKNSELPGSTGVVIDKGKAQLEISIWKNKNQHSMELLIDMKGVNQSVLPVDENGELTAAATQLAAVPWIKVYWPGRGPQTLDVKCDSRTVKCSGLWKDFPYDASKETAFKVEANIRGLEGKVWSPRINSYQVLAQDLKELRLEAETLPRLYETQKGVSALRTQRRNLYFHDSMPAGLGDLLLYRIQEWNFLPENQIRETGFFQTLNPTLFLCDTGELLLQSLSGKSLQTFEVNTGDAFLASKPTILSFATKRTTKAPSSSLRVLEFQEKTP